MTDSLRITIDPTEAGERLDTVLARRFPAASRRRVVALFDDGAITIGRRTARKGDRAVAGTELTLARAPATDDDFRVTPDADAADRLTILHADAALVVVAKPPGMPSQPLRTGELGTAASGLVARFPDCAAASPDPRDGGLVHRLDIGTSGVLVAARHRAAWTALRAAFGTGTVDKHYLALTDGAPVTRECDAPLVQRGKKVAVDHTDGLDAHTTWTPLERFPTHTLLRCHARTGRMHQIRVHLATCGAPISGDTLYGGAPLPHLLHFFLHATSVRLPDTGTTPALTVEAPLPPDREAALTALRAP